MNKTFLNLAVIAGLGLSAQAFAHEAGQANAAVVGDGTGHCITDGSGNNVRTSAWTAEEAAVACGAEVAVAEPAPEPVPAPMPVDETMALEAATLFDYDKDEVRAVGKVKLNDFAARVASMSKVDSITVVGHTDSTGSDAYNQNLSERRAASVKNYLVSQGVSSTAIRTSGMGESQPVADNSTDDGRQQNRRVEISLKGEMAQ